MLAAIGLTEILVVGVILLVVWIVAVRLRKH